MPKDNLQLLHRFIADEEAAMAEGRVGTLWDSERTRIAPLAKRAFLQLYFKDRRKLYLHLMRRTRRLPTVAPSEYWDLGQIYLDLDPDWDRIGMTFRLGRSQAALLPSGFVQDAKEYAARDSLLRRFSGFPDSDKLRVRAARFEKDATTYAGTALEALRHCGFSETRTEDDVPTSNTYWGLILLVAFDPALRLDCFEELRNIEAFARDAEHERGLEATAAAVDGLRDKP
jgi:hypothetical protein